MGYPCLQGLPAVPGLLFNLKSPRAFRILLQNIFLRKQENNVFNYMPWNKTNALKYGPHAFPGFIPRQRSASLEKLRASPEVSPHPYRGSAKKTETQKGEVICPRLHSRAEFSCSRTPDAHTALDTGSRASAVEPAVLGQVP